MHLHWKKLVALGFLVFLALWAAGIVRSVTAGPPEVPVALASILSSFEDHRSLARCANNLKQICLAGLPFTQILDRGDVQPIRVYEKTADLAARTAAFDEDELEIRRAVASFRANVFSERSSGVTPGRVLSLGIAVHPDRFDALLSELSRVGQLTSIQVQQQDRTGEFRQLHAQRQSLKRHQDAVLKLRDSGHLSVEDALKLEQKILEVEKEMQSLQVKLGGLLEQEPSDNLFVTLQEYPPAGGESEVTPARRVFGGLLWALGWWAAAAVSTGLLTATGLSVRTLRPARAAAPAASRV
jgi:hypothetical protein